MAVTSTANIPSLIDAPESPLRDDGAEAPARGARHPAAPRWVWATVATIVGAAGLAWGLPRWWFSRTHVNTDDAQVDGHVMPVSSRVAGYVVRILVADNQHVRAGDTLVVIDHQQVALALERARAREALAAIDAHRTAYAAVREARAQLTAWVARVDAARAGESRSASELERVRALAAAGIAPAEQLERATEAHRKAGAAVRDAVASTRAMRAEVARLEGEAAGAAAKLAASRSDVADAALQLGYTVVTAPASGRVARRAVEQGQLVAPGQPLMALVQDDDMWVRANFKETQLGRIVIGAPVTFTIDAYGDREFRGRVRSIQSATGARFALLPPDNASGNFTRVVQRVPVEIAIDRASTGSYVLRAGLSATVAVEAERAGEVHPAGAQGAVSLPSVRRSER